MKTIQREKPFDGFTLTELLTAIVIVGTLSSIALPSYFKQLSRTCQGDPESIINQVMMQAQAYNDEFGNPASGWSDLDKVATLMTKDGPALGASFQPIPLQTCDYNLWGKQDGNDYLFAVTKKNVIGTPSPIFPFEPEPNGDGEIVSQPSDAGDEFNVVACLNVATGASDIKRGNGSTLAYVDDLTCPKQW
jgi:type IV pilus assembly protein PilA